MHCHQEKMFTLFQNSLQYVTIQWLHKYLNPRGLKDTEEGGGHTRAACRAGMTVR